MQIVIDIPEERYEFIKGLDNTCYDIHTAIAQGIPLPKGHGDLIDLDALKGELWWVTDCPHVKLNDQALEIWKAIDAAKPVIPADEAD